MDVERLKAILAALKETDVTRLTWTDGQETLDLRLGHPPATVHAMPMAPVPVAAAIPTPPSVAPVAPPSEKPAAGAAADSGKKTFTVNSPFVGTFYRSA